MSQSGGSSFPIGKVLLGCGCVSLLVGGATVGALVFGGIWAVNEVKDSEVGSLIQEIDDQAKSAKSMSAKDAKNKLKKGAKKGAMDQLSDVEPEEVLSWPGQPLTQKDVDAHISLMKAWQSSKFYKEGSKNRDTLQELSNKKSDDRSTIDELRTLNAIKNAGMNSIDATEELEKLAEKHGGIKVVMRRYFQIIAVSGAAAGVAGKGAKPDALASDATARKMLAQHGEWQKKYTTWSKVNKEYYRVMFSAQSDPELLERLSKDPDFKKSGKEQKELNKVQSKTPGLLVLGKLPPQTLKTWNGLSASTRASLITDYSQLPLLPIFAFMPAQKYDAHLMAQQILAMEFARLTSESVRQVEAEAKKTKEP